MFAYFVILHMMSDKLTKLLEALAQQATPTPPVDLHSAVWREIRRRKDISSSWVEELTALLWRPRFACSSLALAVMMGASTAWFWSAHAPTRSHVQALDMDVFSATAPSLPSTVLRGDP